MDIQRYTELVVPPEMIGAHIGPSPAHSTWRATDLSYRAAMSLEGCSGFEWNILECTDEEIAQITAFVKLVKELRGLLHAGEVRHADFHDPALRARGVVADDASRAVWVVATVTNLRDVVTERLRPAGLDASRTYRVRLREEIGESRWGWNTRSGSPPPGEGKNSWLTGTAAWTFVDVSQYLLGVQPTFDSLRLEPHLPAQFTELHIEREWRGVRYVIDARRTGKASLTVDGKPVSGTTVPIAAPGTEEVHVSLNF